MHSHVEKLSSPVSPLTPFLELQCYLFPSMVPVKLRQVCVTFFTMVTLGEISPSRSSILHVLNDYSSLFPQSEEG